MACLPVSSKQRSAPCSRFRSCLGVECVGPEPTSGTGSPEGPSPLLGTCLGDRLALELLGQVTVEETPGHPLVPTKQLAAIFQGCECSEIHRGAGGQEVGSTSDCTGRQVGPLGPTPTPNCLLSK